MVHVRRRRVSWCPLLMAMVFGLLGTVASAQSPAEPQEPPPPPEPQSPPPLEAPRVDALPAAPAPAPERAPEGRPAARDVRSEGSSTATPSTRVYVPHEPPPPIAERPSGERPGPRAVWTPGYWDWDNDASRFVWVAGSWRVPPSGMAWTPGRWARDARGWYRIDGSWTRRARRPVIAADRPAWRTEGPPGDHPDDTPPPAPGPDSFYIAGHYAPAPSGDRLAWVPGFWAANKAGWDWVPARWIRRPDGWDYRDGHWMRDPGMPVVERAPARNPRRLRRNADVTVIARDPITGAEVDVEADGDPFPPGPVPAGMPLYMIRPPGGLYGPGGVVVPGAVPPFVRRMLDRVLPP